MRLETETFFLQINALWYFRWTVISIEKENQFSIIIITKQCMESSTCFKTESMSTQGHPKDIQKNQVHYYIPKKGAREKKEPARRSGSTHRREESARGGFATR